MADVLPLHVICAEAVHDLPCLDLLPQERAMTAGMAEKRRGEFATVRHCARIALSALGVPPLPLLPRRDGDPTWPAGVVGSMTHCAGYAAAAVARQSEIHAVGIDAEPHLALPDGVVDVVTGYQEQQMLDELSALDATINWDRLLFCCKEAIYKGWFPITRQWLGFQDVVVTIDPVRRTFSPRPLDLEPSSAIRLAEFRGRWVITESLILAAATVMVSGAEG